ncbi:MAG TPA: polysaccharide deacetylase family protein [Candidatus Avimonas sp.]|nr:polysaccharide deacetylase family protein [Candidatus Avimonas sp.]
MKVSRYYVLNRNHALILLIVLFLFSAAVVALAGSIPAAWAAITSNPQEKRVIRCTDRSQGVVSLTFDAYSSDENIRDICRILAQHDVKATFFVTGSWASKYPESLELLHKNGHKIMNSSDSFSGLASLSKAKIMEKINRCSDIIQAVTGERPDYFRAPDGEYNDKVFEALAELKMLPIGWDVDSLDDDGMDDEGIVKRVTSLAVSGSIIKMSVDGDETVDALPDIITGLKAKGYQFITIPEMIYTEKYRINIQGRQVYMGD